MGNGIDLQRTSQNASHDISVTGESEFQNDLEAEEAEIDDARASKRRMSIVMEQIVAEYPTFSVDDFWTQIETMAGQWVSCFNPVLRATHRSFLRERGYASPKVDDQDDGSE